MFVDDVFYSPFNIASQKWFAFFKVIKKYRFYSIFFAQKDNALVTIYSVTGIFDNS